MAKNAGGSRGGAKSRGLRGKSSHVADWGSADIGKLSRAICAAAITGGALRFGYSRDGGAYAIGIYGDGPPYTEFRKPDDDLDKTLDDIIELFESIADEQGSSPRDDK